MINPIGSHVLVERIKKESVGPIVIPQCAVHESDILQFRVVAVGPGRVDKKGRRHVPEVVAGDRVLWKSYARSPVEVLNQFYLIDAEDIIAVL